MQKRTPPGKTVATDRPSFGPYLGLAGYSGQGKGTTRGRCRCIIFLSLYHHHHHHHHHHPSYICCTLTKWRINFRGPESYVWIFFLLLLYLLYAMDLS